MIPVWLLDVDGVINILPQSGGGSQWPRDQCTERRVRSNGTQWTVTIADAVNDFIRRAHASGLVEIRWHTTWQHDALKLGQAFGLPEFPVQFAPELATRRTASVEDTHGWWKYPAALRVVGKENRRLIWTDDDARFEMSPAERAALDRPHRPALIIAPVSRHGLMAAHLTRIAEFIGLEPSESDQRRGRRTTGGHIPPRTGTEIPLGGTGGL
jgi:hypothetical protein